MGRVKGQLSLDLRRERRGGKCKGAGRKPRGRRASERHKKRPKHHKHNPVHVVLRVDPRVGRVRKHKVWRAIRVALLMTVEKTWFRVCHVSIQGTHLHLIVEADDERCLARGMQGFQISAAHWINKVLRRKGRVFADRYHPEYLTRPLHVRRALAYCLNNWRKHGEDRGSRAPIDPLSSARTFGGWIDSGPVILLAPGTELLPVKFARTWLLREGWKKHGLLSPWDRPSSG